MTMHLVGAGLTTIAPAKKRKKSTESQLRRKYESDWNQYNRDMKRLGAKLKTFDEYVDYRQGRLSRKKKTRVPDPMKVTSQIRQSPQIKSGIGIGVDSAKKEMVYTGTYVKGIATLHKSNSVPITSDEQAVDVARMRRS